jgi:hypothetical protein
MIVHTKRGIQINETFIDFPLNFLFLYNLLHGVPEKLKSLTHSNDFQHFMKLEISITVFTRAPAGPYPEPDESTSTIPSPIESFQYYSLIYT